MTINTTNNNTQHNKQHTTTNSYPYYLYNLSNPYKLLLQNKQTQRRASNNLLYLIIQTQKTTEINSCLQQWDNLCLKAVLLEK